MIFIGSQPYMQHGNQKGVTAIDRNPLNLLVPEVGIEPTWGRPRWILSPVRLPISPLRRRAEHIAEGRTLRNAFFPARAGRQAI